MRRYLGKTALACIAALVTVAVYASETSKMVGYRIKPKSESECVTGEWMANFTTVRNYAEKNGLPLFAMWTNGEKCSHCVKFEGVANSKAFREWMAESGIVFWFGYNGDTSADDKNGGKGFDFCYKDQSLYPIIRMYWKAKKGTVLADGTVLTADKVVVNKYTMGDDLDKRLKASEGGTSKALSIIKKTFAKYVPVAPTSYKGGELAVPSLGGVGLQAEVGLTKSVSIPLSRTNTTAQASVWTNTVKVTIAGSVTTKDVVWAVGQTAAEVTVDMPNTMSEGDTYAIELVDAETGDAVGSGEISVVGAQENSTKNPYWLGERTADTLGWGEWTVDLDLAQAKAAKGGGATLLLVGGGTWCPDCAAADHYFFENPRFKSWCEEKKVALAVVDIPNYNNASSGPSLLAYDVNDTMYNSRTGKYDNYRYVTYNYSGVTNLSERYQSGAGYLSRHGLKPDDDEVVALKEKFRALACDTTLEGGYKRPEATNTRMGVPILLALRADGSVAGRLTAFAVSGPTKFEEGYLERLSEMIAQIGDAEEDANDHPSTAVGTTSVIDRGAVEGERSVSSTDMCDYYPVDASAVGPLVKFSVAGVSPETDDVELTLSLCNNAKSTLETLATVTTNLGSGVELTYRVPGTNCFLKVSYPVDASTKLPGAGSFFAAGKAGSTVCGYSLSTDCVLQPTETNQTFTVKDGVPSVTMAVEAGTTYMLANADESDPSLLEHFNKGTRDGLYIAKETESATIPLADISAAFGYRIWNTGKIGFAVPTASASEKDGQYVVTLVRQGGSAGTAKLTLHLNAARTTTLDEIYEFGDDGRDFSWGDGETDEKTVVIKISDNAYSDGVQKVSLYVDQESGVSDAGIATANFELSIRDDDAAKAGKLALVGVSPLESKTGVVYARRGTTARFGVKRVGGTTDSLAGRVTASVGTPSETEFSWESREGGDSHVREFTLEVPEASKTKLTLKGVGGAKVDTAHRYMTVYTVAADAPQFTSDSFEFSATRYIEVPKLKVTVDPNYLSADGDVKVEKVSGSLPSGLKAALNADGDALVISGIPSKAGSFSAVYRVSKGKVKGLTATVAFSVSDPAVAASPSAPALNPSVAASRTIDDIYVIEDETGLLTGIATITIPRTGRLSAKVRYVDSDIGTVSYSSPCWKSIDEGTGTLTAEMTSRAGETFDVSVAADGKVTLEGFGFSVVLPSEDDRFSAAKSAADWKGAYTVSLPIEDGTNVLAKGSGYIAMKMTSASAVKKGKMTYAGIIPNGKAFSGSAILQPDDWDATLATPNWSKAYMAFMLQSSTDGLGGVLEIGRAEAAGYGIGLRRAVFPATADGSPIAVPRWVHREKATDEADCEAYFGVYGGKYDSTESWKAFYTDYYKLGESVLSFYADPASVDFSDDFGAGEAWSVSGYGLTLGYSSSKKTNSIAKQSKGAAAGFSISLSTATGVVSGSFRAPTENGYATMKYRAVVLPGWGASGCDDCAPGVQPAPERPFISGAAWVKDTFEYDQAAKSTKVVKGCEVTVGIEPGK